MYNCEKAPKFTARGVCKDLRITPYRVTCEGKEFKFTSEKKMKMFNQRVTLNQIKVDRLLDDIQALTGIYYKIDSLYQDVAVNTYKTMEHI